MDEKGLFPTGMDDPGEQAFLGVRMRALDWALLVALWMLPGIITTGLMHFVKDEAWGTALITQMPPWLYWVPATPLIVQLAR
ncbi:MAG TPA: hypothetical protein VMV18_01050, partial [bacterium]|nr:hypothetical protein [bacterium]